MNRDPNRYPSTGAHLPPKAPQDRASLRERAGHLLALASAAACLVALLGASLVPLSYLPQAAFGAAVLLMIAAAWAAEGGPSS